MIRPLATESVSPRSSASANSSASVNMRSISGSERSSIDTTSVFDSRAIRFLRLSSLAVPHHYRIRTIHFRQPHVYALAPGSLHVLAHVIRSNRQLAFATIHQHRKLDRFRTPQVRERI